MTGKSFFGWMLMVVGGLAALLSGGCTVFIIGGELWDAYMRPTVYHSNIGLVGLALIIGGIPCLSGLGVFKWGHKLAKPARFTFNTPVAPSKRSYPRLGLGLRIAGLVVACAAACVTAYTIGNDLLRGKPEDFDMLLTLMIGAVPMIIGIGLVRAGQKMMPEKPDEKGKAG